MSLSTTRHRNPNPVIKSIIYAKSLLAPHCWHIQSSDGSGVEVMFQQLQHPFRQLPLESLHSPLSYPVLPPKQQNRLGFSTDLDHLSTA